MITRDHVYKKIEVTGTSMNSMEEAVNRALGKASQTIRGMRWFEVSEIRGEVENNSVAHWQVTVKIGFDLEQKK